MVGWNLKWRSARLAAWSMIVLMASVAVVAGTGVADQGKIQPGDWAQSSVNECTLNFIFDGTGAQAGDTYIGIAAHCIDGVGDPVSTDPEGVFGEVAYVGMGLTNTARDDFAFIRFYPEFEDRAFAGVRGHEHYPSGSTTSDETADGDLIQVSGFGLGFHLTEVTREQRVATLMYDDEQTYEVYGPIGLGDSGGPLVHMETGKALGIVSRMPLTPPCTCNQQGPTVERMIDKAADDGFQVELRTV